MGRTTHLTLEVPPPFDFHASATAHGWIALAPTAWLVERQSVQRVERLRAGNVVLLEIAGAGTVDRPTLRIRVDHSAPLTAKERMEIGTTVSHMFRFEEDFSEWYALCQARGHPWTRLTAGWGRLLRSPTMFEDVIKTICTTNTRWSGTKRMIARLVTTLGDPYAEHSTLHAFPTPEAIARAQPAVFTTVIPLGYRAAYIQQLAQQVASGALDLEALRDPSLSCETLKRKLLAIKGVGPYAAHTLLMLLGHYDELAIDAGMRAFVRRKYVGGQPPDDGQIRAVYDSWGRWKYLAYWFDADADA